MCPTNLREIGLALTVALGLLFGVPVFANSAESTFFKGKTIEVIVAYEAGSSQDLEARLVANHLGKHIPGNPKFSIRNMPGAGGLRALRYVYKTVAPDGLTIGFFGVTPPVEQLMAPYRKERGVLDFDVTRFRWLGSTGGNSYLFSVHRNSGIKTLKELLASKKTIKAGATRPGSTTFTGPALLREIFKAPIDIITGYSGGSDRDLAFFREEVHAVYSSWPSYVARNQSWLEQGIIVPIVMMGDRISDDDLMRWFKTKDVPHILELIEKKEDTQLVQLAIYPGSWGRLIGVPPATHDDRVNVLRTAFTALTTDKELMAENRRRKTEVYPMRWDVLEKMIKEYLNVSPDTVRRFIRTIEEN